MSHPTSSMSRGSMGSSSACAMCSARPDASWQRPTPARTRSPSAPAKTGTGWSALTWCMRRSSGSLCTGGITTRFSWDRRTIESPTGPEEWQSPRRANIYQPNFMVGSSSNGHLNPPEYSGDPDSWNGCFARSGRIPRHLYPTYLPRLSLMISGDDPSSARFFDAITAGTPSMVISSGWYDQSAPFRCRVPYKDMAFSSMRRTSGQRLTPTRLGRWRPYTRTTQRC
mmetsp:Transcript_10267/g.29322  ORF Transcript_10267/g.29322 Transcript_10267/m.29322 type:complete len:226 (-) Transcript_10267:36-713(-)